MYLFNKYLWSFSKLTIMWTYNQTVMYLKNQNRSVYRVFKAESENIYNDGHFHFRSQLQVANTGCNHVIYHIC